MPRPPPVSLRVFTNGLRMAIERGRGRAAVPVRSAFVGAILGIFGVTAVLVFASSLNHVVESPRRFGWPADFSAPENTTVSANSCIRNDYGLLEEPGVGAVASVCEQSDNIALNGHQTSGWSLTSLRGAIEPTVVAGRPPDGPEDVALGATTLQTLGKHIGDSIEGTGPHGKRQYRIVGEVLFPSLGQIQPLADGALFTGPGFAPLFDANNYSRYLIGRFTPHADREAVQHWIATNPNLSPTTVPSVPVEIERIHQVDWLPTTLAILFAVLASIAVGYALVTSVHRRRRELAVFKTLGFKRRQVRATISWQAMVVAIVGLLVGLPAGLITGRVIWRRIADNLGIANAATIPTLAIAARDPGRDRDREPDRVRAGARRRSDTTGCDLSLGVSAFGSRPAAEDARGSGPCRERGLIDHGLQVGSCRDSRLRRRPGQRLLQDARLAPRRRRRRRQ